jgi:hypothetical protein
MCGMRGHDLLLHFDQHRIWLECCHCGRQTPGWHVSPLPGTARRVR